MADDALVAVKLRNEFYKDSQRKIILALFVSIVVNFILGSLLVYIVTHPPTPKYFATSINGRITPLVPLSMPNQSEASILQWANMAAIAVFSYNFVNYRDELQASSVYFTPEGWKQFLNEIARSNILVAVKAKKLVVSAVATAAPIILDKGLLDGVYSWRVQMPILITYQSASELQETRDTVTMLIRRVSTLNSPRGIGISQIVVAPSTGGVTQ